jgi:hypothetical protein
VIVAPDDAWTKLRRVVAEALILQDAAEELLLRIHDRPDPAELARPWGRISRRFVELRAAVPPCGDPELDGYTGALRQILDHHALLLRTSLGLLAGAARSELLDARLDDVDGFGAPGQRLEALRAALLDRASLLGEDLGAAV